MPISIKDADTDSKIRDLAALTGESITVAVRIAIEQRLRRESGRRRAGVATRLLNLSLAKTNPKRFEETVIFPLRASARSAEAAIGYDEHACPLRSRARSEGVPR
jgi:antitoxin VapB